MADNPWLSQGGGSSGGGNPWVSGGGAPRKKGGGGLLGTLEHVATRGTENLYHAAINAPAGIVYYAGQLGRAATEAATLGRTHQGGISGFVDVNKQIGKQIAADVRHPLRNPGYTALDLLPVVGAGARLGLGGAAALRAAQEGATAAEVAKAAVAKPTLTRTLRVGNLEVHPESSVSSLGKVVQKGTDTLLQASSGRGYRVSTRIVHRKVGKTLNAEARAIENKAKALPAALIAAGRKLTPGEQKALEIVAEEAPLEGRITAAAARVTGARDTAARTRHQAELDLLHAAKQHLDLSGGKPALAADQTRLTNVYRLMQRVAGDRETLLQALGLLSDEAILSRQTKAARVALGAKYVPPTPGKLGVPSPSLLRQRAQVERLQGLFDRATVKRDQAAQALIAKLTRAEARYAAAERRRVTNQPAAAPAAGRPSRLEVVPANRPAPAPVEIPEPPVDPRAARLAELEKAHNRQLDRIRNALFGKIDKTEGQARSAQRAEARKQQSGMAKAPGAAELAAAERRVASIEKKLAAIDPNDPAAERLRTALRQAELRRAAAAAAVKPARRRGRSGAKAEFRPTLRDEQRAAAERWFDEEAAKLPKDHPVRVAWERRVNEMEKLRNELSPNPEDVFGGPVMVGEGAGVYRITFDDGTTVAKAAASPETALKMLTAAERKRAARVEKTYESAQPKETLHPSLEEHASGQTRLTTAGEQTNLLPLEDRLIPSTEPTAPSALDEAAAARAALAKAEERAAKETPAKKKEPPVPAPAKAKAKAKPAGRPAKRKPSEPPGRIGSLVITPGKVLKPPGSARAEKLGGALSVAKEQLASMEAAAARRVAPTGIIGQEGFVASPSAIRVPDVATRKGRKALRREARVGAQGSIGHLRPPGSVTHEYTGVLREHAVRRVDTTNLIAESGLEASRYAGLKHIHDLVRRAAQPFPTREDDIAVRLDNLKPTAKTPPDVRRFLDDPSEFFKNRSHAEQTRMLDKARERLFIDPRKLTGEDAASFERLNQEGKIGWVPRRILGDFAKAQAPLSSVTGTKAVTVIDAINNGSRFAILYLKPAYAVPNILGNAALNVLQQGFGAPKNLARSARLSAEIGAENAAMLDAIMGEGFALSVSAHGTGPLASIVDRAARFWSKGVDQPFRRASFLHEAGKAGYRTPEQIVRLLNDPAQADDLARIAIKANREIIDYANLTPVEREIVRRVVFFYPWIKGATVYTARMLREHPFKAAALAQLAQYGQAETGRRLGPVPSYLEGTFQSPFGHNRTVNPAAAAIFQTPAEAGAAIAGLLTGNPAQLRRLESFPTPALALALAEKDRTRWNGVPYPSGTSFGTVAADTLLGGLPQVTLAKAIREALNGKGRTKLYPPSLETAFAQFLVGSSYPRRTNLRYLNQLAANEKARAGR